MLSKQGAGCLTAQHIVPENGGKLGDVYQERQAGTGCSPHHSDISGAHTRVSPLKCCTHSLTKSQIGFLIMKPPLVFLHSSAATQGV